MGNDVLHLSWSFNVFPNPIISDSVKKEAFFDSLVDPVETRTAFQCLLHRLEEQGSTVLKKFSNDKCTRTRAGVTPMQTGNGPALEGLAAEDMRVLADHTGHEPALCPTAAEGLASTELWEQEMIPLLVLMTLLLGYYTWIWAPQSNGEAANWRDASVEQLDSEAGAGDV